MKENRAGAAFHGIRWLLFGLIGAGAMAYAALRAARLSFTFDEAATYISYLSSNIHSALDLASANNHILYTLFARLGSAFAGSSELVLRVPSLFGLALYLLFSWLLMNRFFGRIAALAGFLLLNLNPYVLDFFSLGRGYGLALGLEMTALYFFLVYLDSTRRERGDRERILEAALLAAWASTLANISFLNVIIGLWIFILLYFLITRWMARKAPAPGFPAEKGAAPGRRLVLAAIALSIPFNLIVVSQYIRLSRILIEPVTVRLRGLDEEEMQRVLVSGDDTYSRDLEFFHQDGVWSLPGTIPLRRLKLGFPGSAIEKLQQAEIEIGDRRLRFGRPEIKRWKRFQREGLEFYFSNIPEAQKKSVFGDMSEVMNWKGDDVFLRAYAGKAGLVLAIAALFLGLAFGLGRRVDKWRLLRNLEWRPVRDSACLSALYLFCPILILKRSEALYYGGRTGFIKDTVGSLISDSFYGIRYAARQETVALAFIMGSIIFFLLMLGGQRLRGKNLADHPEALSMFAVMAIIALLIIAQRAVFGHPYIMGRTAIFLIPLYSLFLLFFLRDLGRLGGAWRPAAYLLLAAVVSLSVYHGVRSANLTHTLDWSYDADTKQMVSDLVSVRARDPSARPWVRLGVDWHFWPSSEYYRRRASLSWLDIKMLPFPRGCDLFYLFGDHSRASTQTLIKRYPMTGNVLVE